jgi:hypothetical protein
MSLEKDREREAQLDRIEAKLDALILALAEDDEDKGPTCDLDGNEIPGMRDEHDTL